MIMSSDVSEGGLSTAKQLSSLSWRRGWRVLTASSLELASRMGTAASMARRSRAVLFDVVAAVADPHRTMAVPQAPVCLNPLLGRPPTRVFRSVVAALFPPGPRPAIHVQRPLGI